jgi:hypothetical protein
MIGLGCSLAGCGGADYLPVSGAVTLDGKPVAGAAVAFVPVEDGPVGNAITDAEGRFDLNTVNERGVLAGNYRVGVVLQEVGAWAGDPTGTSGSPPPGAPPPKWIVPYRYASPETSGLAADVRDAQQHFDFALTTDAPATELQ